ncbi:ATP synthase subunit a, chloroplastic, partial [Ananas comosus]
FTKPLSLSFRLFGNILTDELVVVVLISLVPSVVPIPLIYWQIGGLQIHAQVLITSWVVIAILLGSVIIAVRNPQTIPTDGQNFFEYVLEFIRDLSKTQIGEEYGPWKKTPIKPITRIPVTVPISQRGILPVVSAISPTFLHISSSGHTTNCS